MQVKQLLHEYYKYKVQQKANDRERKLLKQICNFILDNELLDSDKLMEEISKEMPLSNVQQREKAIAMAKEIEEISDASRRREKKSHHRK